MLGNRAARADRLAIVGLLILTVLSWLPRLRGPIDLRWDAGVYYVLGTSLAERKGYRLLNEPGEIEAKIYPPLLPASVALLQRLLGTSDPVIVGTWLRGLSAVLFATLVYTTYRFLRRVARPSFSFLATIVCALSFLGPWLSDRCYTDIPFALMLMLFVQPRASETVRGDVGNWLLGTAAFLLRTIGIALLVAWAIEAVVRRKWRVAIIRMAAAVVPVIAWQLYLVHVERTTRDAGPAYAYQRADYNLYNVTYGRHFTYRDHLHPELGRASTGERVWRAISAQPSLIAGLGGAISQPREYWELVFQYLHRVPIVRQVARWRLITVTMLLLGLIVVAGLGMQLARRAFVLPLVVLIYLAGLCAMPHSYFGELPRYMWVLSPLLVSSALVALDAAHRAGTTLPSPARSIGAIAVAALSGFVVALSVVAALHIHRSDLQPVVHDDWNGHRVAYRLFSYQNYHAFDGGLEWLKHHAAATDVVASTTPQWIYLRTGLKAVFPPFEQDAAVARDLLDGVPVRFIVIADWLSQERALPIVKSDPLSWRVAYADGDFVIYERMRNRS